MNVWYDFVLVNHYTCIFVLYNCSQQYLRLNVIQFLFYLSTHNAYSVYFYRNIILFTWIPCTRCSKSGYFYSLSLARYFVTLILEVINTKTFNKIVSLSIFGIPWIFFSFEILKKNHLIITWIYWLVIIFQL